MERISPERLRDFLRLLPAFLDGLRAQEYKVGTRQHIAAQELVGEMVARGSLPASFADLGDWLAPLFCTSLREQTEFRTQFRRWLLDNKFASADEVARQAEERREAPAEPTGEHATLPTTGVRVRPVGPAPTAGERARLLLSALAGPRPLRRLLTACAGLLAVALIIFAASRIDWNKQEQPQPPPTPAPTTPTPTPTIATTTASPTNSPLPMPSVTPQPPATQNVGHAYDLTKPSESTIESPDLTKVDPDVGMRPETLWHRVYLYALAVGLALPFVWLGAWLYRRRKRRAKQEERWQPDKCPRLDKIKVTGPRERVFGGAWLRQAAREMRRHRSVASAQLEARETVLATARRAGLFTPSYGKRRALPEYLALIDRAGFADQLAQLNSDVVRRLADNDVYVDAYYFDGDPARCRDAREDSQTVSLQDLAARHPEHRLLVFGEGDGLISPKTGRPQDSVGQFTFWEQRALLTTVPRSQWGEGERALMKAGLPVLPADAEGLRALADAINSGAQPRVPEQLPSPPYPSALRESPDIWRERAAPPEHQSARLLSQLQRYLGPGGYELLSACAVYPLLQWGVTVYLASQMLEPAEAEAKVRALVRLPWFRHGTMPEWLRVRLIEELPEERRRLVRELLERLLISFIEDPQKGLRLPPVESLSASPAPGLFAGLAARRTRRRRLRLLIEHAPPRSPVGDPVFVNFVTSNGPALLLPERVRRFIFRRGVAAYGLRPAPALMAALALSLTAFSLLLLARPDDDLAARGWPDFSCPLVCPRPYAKTPANTPYDFEYTPTYGQRGQSVNLDVHASKDGEYDFTAMRIAPKDGAASGLTVKLLSADKLRLNKQITIAPDAPLGETILQLYDGNQLKASLPFTVTDAAPPAQCPVIKVNCTDKVTDNNRISTCHTTVSGAPPGHSPLTYGWLATRADDEVMSVVTVSADFVFTNDSDEPMAASVTVNRLPPNCLNVARFIIKPREEKDGSPPFVGAEPFDIVVCPSNPKLNEPSDSIVHVTFDSHLYADSVRFDASVTGGKIKQLGRTPEGLLTYDWDLSGLTPKTYTVTISPFLPANGQRFKSSSTNVDVAGCPTTPPPLTPTASVNRMVNHLIDQHFALASLRERFIKDGELTRDEDVGIAQAQARLNSALGILNSKIQVPGWVLDAETKAALTQLLDPVNSALSDLDAEVLKVANKKTRTSLAASIGGLRSSVRVTRDTINQ